MPAALTLRKREAEDLGCKEVPAVSGTYDISPLFV